MSLITRPLLRSPRWGEDPMDWGWPTTGFGRDLIPGTSLLSDIVDPFFGAGTLAPFGTRSLVAPTSRRLGAGGGLMNIDLEEDDTRFHLYADAPGVQRENVHVKVLGNNLRIDLRQRETKEGGDAMTHWSERYSGRQTRSFPLPDNVDVDGIDAKLEEGVLHVIMPKTSAAAANVRQIKIS